MSVATEDSGWRAMLAHGRAAPLGVLLGGVLLHSMNVMMTVTVLPSIVAEVGGAALMSWTSTAFLASSIVAATSTGMLTGAVGARRAYCLGAVAFGAGALACGLAPSMDGVVAGRFVQGFGGGMLAALAYVLVRTVMPEALWPRAFALLSGVWGVSVLLGPLLGGLFAEHASWRGAFLASAALAAALCLLALATLPPHAPVRRAAPRLPGLRLALVCGAIALLSLAGVLDGAAARLGATAAAFALAALMLRLDRRAPSRLLPADAFAVATPTGLGLWCVLLVCIAYSGFPLFAPLFLQRLHGFGPLAAGYLVALASCAWTLVGLWVATLPPEWTPRLVLAGPLAIAAGLAGVGLLMPAGPALALPVAIAAIGGGVGACWAFLAQRVMAGARAGDEAVAASAVVTVQQAAFAVGAALAGLVANAAGLADAVDPASVARAALWVPLAFVPAALAASLTVGRSNRLAPPAP